ncbi:MAG: hypothetical protein MH132_12510 [Hydrotalea sp.]|nr:hypothetical protein [Hydrotalea sp.]
MTAFKRYLKKLYRVLAFIAVLIGILVFTTGKTSLTDNINLLSEYFSGSSKNDSIQSSPKPPTSSGIPKSDNLITTVIKTFFVIVAIIFLTIATIISAVLELFIWVVSWGDNSFYCTKELWNLCWNKIVSKWYWEPSNSTYLWITFLLYSGFFGNESREKKLQVQPNTLNKNNIRRK